MNEWFRKFARAAATSLGSATAFFCAVLVIVVWVASGPVFRYSEAWQLVINTSTTIVTFLMVFLIQNSQNRESVATQIKLDELIRSIERARNTMINVEERADEDLLAIQRDFREICTAGDQRASESTAAATPAPALSALPPQPSTGSSK